MDPVLEIDQMTGNGQVTLYRYGKTWRVRVINWVCEKLPYQPPDNPMNKIAQMEVTRLKEKDWSGYCL